MSNLLRDIAYHEIHGFYWLMEQGIALDDIYNKVNNFKYSKELSHLSEKYFATNSVSPERSTQKVLDFIMEHHNEEPRITKSGS